MIANLCNVILHEKYYSDQQPQQRVLLGACALKILSTNYIASSQDGVTLALTSTYRYNNYYYDIIGKGKL